MKKRKKSKEELIKLEEERRTGKARKKEETINFEKDRRTKIGRRKTN